MTYEEENDLKNLFNLNKDKFFNRLDFMIEDKSLINFNRYSVGSSVRQEKIIECVDMLSLITKTIISESNTCVYKEISKRLSKSEYFEYINCCVLSEVEISRNITDILSTKSKGSYNTIITNDRLACIIQDNYQFISSKINTPSNGLMYLIGELFNFRIFVDPMMTWNDDRIYLFNDTRYNLEYDELETSYNQGFNPHIKLSFNLSIGKIDSLILYIIDNNSIHHGHYKSIARDIKIDSLFDEIWKK